MFCLFQGCPEPFPRANVPNHPCPTDPSKMESAHVVYAGHNHFGNEMHWLPAPYLEAWWQKHWSSKDDALSNRWQTLDGRQIWCGTNLTRPVGLKGRSPKMTPYFRCAEEMGQEIDALGIQTLKERYGSSTLENDPVKRGQAYAELYASLPVLRVTVIREPFSWLLAKFFWHHLDRNGTCNDLEYATFGSGDPDIYKGHVTSVKIPPWARNPTLDGDSPGPGWARRYALLYIVYVCGEDCLSRLESGDYDLREIEAQAAHNLRNSFAVVGLLEDSEAFFDMVHARVEYMDVKANAQLFKEDVHKSKISKDRALCMEQYNDTEFQARMLEASPEIAALVRLYEVGVEVNKHHMEEIRSCSGI